MEKIAIALDIWCLIVNAHLGKIPSFGKIFNLNIAKYKVTFDYYFYLISVIVIQAWHYKVETIVVKNKNLRISYKKFSIIYNKNRLVLCE
jgi:hypothetical protein